MHNSKTDSFVYLKRTSTENPKAPFVKGFISFTPELLRELLSQEPDSYGRVKLDIALWTKEQGVLQGSGELPKQREQAQPKQTRLTDDF